MRKLAALLLGLLVLLPVSNVMANVSDEDYAVITVRTLTDKIKIEVDDLSTQNIWTLPYQVIADFDKLVDDGLVTVKALDVPECLAIWEHAVELGLEMLAKSIQVVGEAMNVPTDDDKIVFAATGPPGYVMLTETAPALLDASYCEVPQGSPLPSNAM